MSKLLNIIVAHDQVRVIGANDESLQGRERYKMLWRIPQDLPRFKKKTTGQGGYKNALIVGRKTFDSFGKPLPKRFHIVITQTPEKFSNTEHLIFVRSFEEALAIAKGYQEIWVIGGAEIYKLAMRYPHILHVTAVPGDHAQTGAVYFPEYHMHNYTVPEPTEPVYDEEGTLKCTFITLHQKPCHK